MPRPKKIAPYKKYLRYPNIQMPRSTVWYKQTQQQQQQNINNYDVESDKQIHDSVQSNFQDSLCSGDDSFASLKDDSDSSISSLKNDNSSVFLKDDSDSSISSLIKDDSNRMESSYSSSSNISNSLSESINDDSILGNGEIDEPHNELAFYENIRYNNQSHQNMYYEENDEIQQQHYRNAQREDRKLLYNGAQISANESDILIMSFIIRWGLEDKGIEHLLRLIDCHMPIPLLGSKYLFLKKFPTPSMKIRYICPECSDLLPPDINEGIECLCGHYRSMEILKNDGNFFVQLSISDQIQQIMSNSKLVNEMRKECQENDVINGKIYKRLRNRGVIDDNDITLQWNTDGVNPFKSCNVSVWPIQACINELPFNTRKNNMHLCGLYYGKKSQ